MQTGYASPLEIILWHHNRTTKELVGLVQNPEWLAQHPITVFKAPEELGHLGSYILNDGHKRTVAALRAGLPQIPILVLETAEDVTGTIGMDSLPYGRVYENAVELVKTANR